MKYKTEPDWDKFVHELTDGRCVEKIVEVVGPETFQDSLQAAAPDGEIALVGFLGQSDKKLGYFDLFGKASVRSVSVGSRTDLEEMNQLIEAKIGRASCREREKLSVLVVALEADNC